MLVAASPCARFPNSLPRIVDEVATCGQSDSVGIRFLWAVVNNNSCVRDGSVARDLFDLVVREHEDGVRAWRVCGCVALGEVPKSLPKARAHVSHRSGSFCRRLYLVMDSPVVG